MNKRDLLFSVIDPKAKPARIPAAFFLHFDPAYHLGQPAVDKHLEYFRYTGMDFVKIQFELPFPRQAEIQTPADWAKLPFFKLDHYEPMLKVVEGWSTPPSKEAPVLLTLYSPYMLINNMVGAETTTRLIQEDPDAYRVAIGRMTESLLQFVRAAHQGGAGRFLPLHPGRRSRAAGRPEPVRDLHPAVRSGDHGRDQSRLSVQHPARVRLPRAL